MSRNDNDSFRTLVAAKVVPGSVILNGQNIALGRVNRLFFKNSKLFLYSFPETKYVEED